MKFMKKSLIVGSVGMLLLGVFSNSRQAANTSNSFAAFSETVAKKKLVSQHSKPNQGGQVVESGKYHLEFVPASEANGTHIDLFL